MDKQRREAREMVKGFSPKEKLKHFWYYYKKHTIVALIAVIVVTYSVVQCVTKIDYDLNISLYSCYSIDEERLQSLEDELETIIEDINGNNSKDVLVLPFLGNISSDQLDERAQAAYNKIVVELSVNQYHMYIVDKPYFDFINKNFGQIVENVVLLNEVPKAKELLDLGDDELYLFTVPVFDAYKDDEKKTLEYENALLVQEYFKK